VVAIVHRRPECESGPHELLDAASGRLARYKLPKAIVFVDRIVRSPSGKADYRWAREIVARAARP